MEEVAMRTWGRRSGDTSRTRRDPYSAAEGSTSRRGLLAAGGVMGGATARTEWLGGQLARDAHGFLLMGADIPPAELEAGGPPPLPLETSRPGIFCVGDVRSGSVKRVATAIGEGAMAVRLVFDRVG